MESEERMILRDMPVDTRNYTIIDNITGKAIDQSNYTLSIDNEVIGKLNQLKKINEEKIKQAALKDKYGDSTSVSTFTPEDNAVFTPVYNDDYIDFHDFNTNDKKEEVKIEANEPIETNEVMETPIQPETTHAEVIQSDTLLARVVARDPSIKQAEEEARRAQEEAELALQNQNIDYITSYSPSDGSAQANENTEQQQEVQADNSLFTPEMATLQQASEQITKIDPDKLGGDIKAHKEQRKGTEKIQLDKMEIISGKKVAWMAYLLFFIPLLFKRRNRFVRLHANEGLELNLMELIGGLLVAQYFLLPKFMETINAGLEMGSMIGACLGAALLGASVATAVIMMFCSLFGLANQTPWLWKRRFIKVPNERTSD